MRSFPMATNEVRDLVYAIGIRSRARTAEDGPVHFTIAFVIVIAVVILDDGCIGFNDEALGALIEFGRKEISVDAFRRSSSQQKFSVRR